MSKTSTFEVPKFSQNFPPLPFRWVLPAGLWGPRAAAPEAKHHCMRQPRTARFPPSRGSSRPRQRWMCRTTTAVASDEGFGGGKPSWGNGIFTWRSGWNVDSIQGFSWFVFSLFMESVSQNMCTTILLCSLWSRYFTIVSFVHLELFFLWSDFRVGLCSWVWGVSTTEMWHLPFCRSDNLNVSFSIAIASSTIFGLDTRNKTHNFCSVPPAGDSFLFSLVSRTKAFHFTVISAMFDFWGAQIFSDFFSPSVPLGSACGLWGPRAAAPEAAHRCTTQPTKATFPPSRGSSRPRQRWMRRTTAAVASGRRIWGGKPLEAMGSLREEVDEMLNVSLFVESVLPKHVALIFCVVLCDPDHTVPTPWVRYSSIFMESLPKHPCCLHWRF